MKRDYKLGILAGLFMGLLFLPVLRTAKPELYQKFFIFVPIFFILAVPIGLFVANIISKKISVVWQLAKFVVTGGLNALMDLGVLSLTTFIFLNYLDISPEDVILKIGIVITFYSAFKGFSFIVANVNSYFWNKYWTFKQKKENKTEFLQFFLISIIGFLINVSVASLVFRFVDPVLNLNPSQWGLIGAIFGSIAGLAWNFLGYKFIVFKK